MQKGVSWMTTSFQEPGLKSLLKGTFRCGHSFLPPSVWTFSLCTSVLGLSPLAGFPSLCWLLICQFQPVFYLVSICFTSSTSNWAYKQDAGQSLGRIFSHHIFTTTWESWLESWGPLMQNIDVLFLLRCGRGCISNGTMVGTWRRLWGFLVWWIKVSF